jgi:hypothetical protein
MNNTITTRRQFIKTAGGTALGLLAVGSLTGAAFSCSSNKNQVAAETTQAAAAFPWPYQKIDPTAAAEAAYAAYYTAGCMYGGFEGIISQLREAIGAPYDSFPSTMMGYGGAGVAGWGTLCGALNGVAAAISLVSDPKVRSPLISEVFGWYGNTALPVYKPASPKFEDIPVSTADSQLCHVSVSTWCTKSGFSATSPERAERCAWLTASVVKYTAEVLNAQADGSFAASFVVPESVTGCLSCHGKNGMGNVHNTNQSTCINCHSDLGANHPGG